MNQTNTTISKLIAKIARYALGNMTEDVREAVMAAIDGTATEEQETLLLNELNPKFVELGKRPVSKTYENIAAHQWCADPADQREVVTTKTAIAEALIRIAFLLLPPASELDEQLSTEERLVEAIDEYIALVASEWYMYQINGVKFLH